MNAAIAVRPVQTSVSGSEKITAPAGQRRWIVNPIIDLTFCCGGLLYVLLAVHYALLPQAFHMGAHIAEPFPLLGLIGTMLLADTHNMATLVMLYRNKEKRDRLRFVSYLGAACCIGLGLCALLSSTAAAILARLYLVFIVQHVIAQAYGLALLYCEKRNYRFAPVERQIFKLLMQSVTVYAIMRQFADPAKFRASFFGNVLPVWGPIPPVVLSLADGAFLILLIAFAGIVVRKAISERAFLPVPSLMLIASVLLVAFLGGQAAGVLALYIPAFFHGSQYLVISTAAHLKAEGAAAPAGRTGTIGLMSNDVAWRYWGGLILLAMGTFAFIPQVITVLGFSFPAAFFAVFVTINFHHFLADAFLWKLRDPAVKQLVVA